MRRPSVRSTVIASVLLVAAPAWAGNEDEFLVGNHAAAVGGAVVASVRDGSATYYNPAGVAGIKRNRIDVGGSVYALRFHRAEDYIRSAEGETRDGTVREFVAVPTQVAFARRITDEVSIGLGYFVPRTSNLVLRERIAESVGAFSTEYSVNTIQVASEFVVGAVVGWEIGRSVRFGGGLLGTYDDVTDSASLFAAVRNAGVIEKTYQADLLTTQTIVGLAPTVGAQIDVTERLTLAVAARAPRLSVFNQGLTRLDTTDGTNDGVAPSSIAADTVVVPIDGQALGVVHAGRYFGGLSYRIGATELTLDADAQPPLTSVSANIRRETAFNVRAGVFHQATPRFGFGAGLFTDTETEALDPDTLFSVRGDFYGGTVGIRVSNEHELAPSEPADSLIFTTVFAFKYAVSAGDGVSITFDRTAAADQIVSGGSSSATVQEMSLYVGSGVYF